MIKKQRIIIILFITLFLVAYIYAIKNTQSNYQQKKPVGITKNIISVNQKTVTFGQIIKSQTPSMLSQRVCNFNPSVCTISNALSHDGMLTYRFYRMFTSVILYESGNFNFHKNMNLNYVMGYPQINTRIWTLHKIHKMGFNINSLHELITDPIVAILVSETILWNNISVAYKINPNENAILDYASSYYGVNMSYMYTHHLAHYYYNKHLLNKTMNKKFTLTKYQFNKYNFI